MAASPSFNKLHFQDPDPGFPLIPRKNPCKFFRNFIIVVLVLVVLPLFPSRAPEFINQTPFTKVWELLYLLFIGIVVCYGLFTRRAVKANTEPYPNLGIVKPQFWSPLTGICQISSIFENGFENSCGFDNLRIPQLFSPFPKGLYPNGAFAIDGSGNVSGFGESMVLDQIGKIKSSIEYKPLGSPVRSLRSGKMDSDRLESSSVSGSSVRFKGSSNGGERVESGVRGLVPTNLEGKFIEEVAPSPIPWRSRSSRMDVREEMSTIKSPSHFRPTSHEEFEGLKSQSFRHSGPFQANFKHSSFGVPSFASIPTELPKPKMEDLKGKEKFDGSKAPTLQPKMTSLSEDSLTRSSNTQHLSIGSTSEMNVGIGSKDEIKSFKQSKKDTLNTSREQDAFVNAHSKKKLLNAKMQDLKGKKKFIGPQVQPKQPSLSSLNGNALFKNVSARSLSVGSSSEVKMNGVENYLKDFLEKKEDDFVLGRRENNTMDISKDFLEKKKDDGVLGRRENNTMDISKLSQKPTDLVNGYTPGKSVRTIRSSEKMVDTNETGTFPSSIDNMFGLKFEEGVAFESKPTDTRKLENIDDVKETKFESIQMSSDEKEEGGSDVFSDAEPHSGEVDRRADEFIAKFKEQIRLQKVASRRLNFS